MDRPRLLQPGCTSSIDVPRRACCLQWLPESLPGGPEQQSVPLAPLTGPPSGEYPPNRHPGTGSQVAARLLSPLTDFIQNQAQTFSSKRSKLNPTPRPRRMPQLRLGFTLPCHSLSSPLPGYVSVRAPKLRSLRVPHFKSLGPSSGISPPGGREERLSEGLWSQAPCCTYPRSLLPRSGEQQRRNIPASWGQEKAVILSSAYSAMHSGGETGAVPSQAAEPLEGPGPALPLLPDAQARPRDSPVPSGTLTQLIRPPES